MNEIVYRKLLHADVPKFIELRQKQLQEEGAAAIVDLTKPLTDYYKNHIANGMFVSWLAIANDEIIATSGISFIEKPPYYSNPTGRIGILSSMYTQQTYRRRGIAKKLLGLVIDEAKNYGCGAVQITASDAGVLLYRDFGFVENSNYLQFKLL